MAVKYLLAILFKKKLKGIKQIFFKRLKPKLTAIFTQILFWLAVAHELCAGASCVLVW